jgi:hypothetical protein
MKTEFVNLEMGLYRESLGLVKRENIMRIGRLHFNFFIFFLMNIQTDILTT